MKFTSNIHTALIVMLLILFAGCQGSDGDTTQPKVTISGTVSTGTSSTLASSKPNSLSRYAVETDRFIDSGFLQIFAQNGKLIGTGTTTSIGEFSVDVTPGKNYFIQVTSIDGLGTTIRSYIDSVGSSGLTGLKVNAYSTAIVHTMESNLSTSFTSSAGGYSGSADLAALVARITSDPQFASLVNIIQASLAAANVTELSTEALAIINNIISSFTQSNATSANGTSNDGSITWNQSE